MVTALRAANAVRAKAASSSMPLSSSASFVSISLSPSLSTSSTFAPSFASPLSYNASSALSRKRSSPVMRGHDRKSMRKPSKVLKPNPPKELCMFFNLYGKCKKLDEGKCAFIHDPDKVGICRKWLKKTCDDPVCLLKHERLADRLPVCRMFLAGTCFSTSCLYSHVKVNIDAPVCPNFTKGYCPDGAACKLKHVWTKRKDVVTMAAGKSSPVIVSLPLDDDTVPSFLRQNRTI